MALLGLKACGLNQPGVVESRLTLNHMATGDHCFIVGMAGSSGPWVLASLVFHDLSPIASCLVSPLAQMV